MSTVITPDAVESRPAPDAGPSLADLVRAEAWSSSSPLFVDLTGKPCAKLVPAQAVGQLRAKASLRGYAVGAIGQQPSDPDIMAMPIPRRTHRCRSSGPASHSSTAILGRGQAMALRAARHPQAGARRRGRQGLSLRVGAEVEYFLLKRRRERGAERRRLPRRRVPTVLRRAWRDAHVRPSDLGVQGHERARLGQLRQRPRRTATASFEQNFAYATR